MRWEVPMHKNPKTTLPRIKNFYTSERFRESNLIGKLYPNKSKVSISHWALPGGEGAWKDYNFSQVKKQSFNPVSLGSSYGPTWSTHWFKVEFTIPAEWKGKQVHFRWNSNSEAALYNSDGNMLIGFTSDDLRLKEMQRTDYILYKKYNENGTDTAHHVFYVEMAINKMFGATEDDTMISPVDPKLSFELELAEIAVQDPLVYDLMNDLDILYQMAEGLKNTERGIQSMNLANQMINYILIGELETARGQAADFFSTPNAQAGSKILAMGNCHIDTAWLWPYSETRRKVARSFSSQLDLAKQYSDFSFVASQAIHFAWLKEDYPELFERVKNSKILPVGTSWCELDGNLPNGESFIRQLFIGQKFYMNEFGYRCKEFWLPDTFGYSAQIPALIKHCGIDRFLSQKMSWNTINVFPNNSFIWEGLDGTSVIAHFPPTDRYDSVISVEEVLKTHNNNKDKGRITTTALLFGHGDGGGGPDRKIYERRKRLENVYGMPMVKLSTPDELFGELEEQKDKLMRWTGELFLEFHNGTYTSQAFMKSYVRLAEFRLRDSELMLSLANLRGQNETLKGDLTELEDAWKKVLLNEFHDVLPGCSVEIVYPEAIRLFEESIATADSIFFKSLRNLGSESERVPVAINTLQWPRTEVINLSDDPEKEDYKFLKVPAFGFAEISSVTPEMEVKVVAGDDGSFIMENLYITAVITKEGLIQSLKIKDNDRELFNVSPTSAKGYGNQITIYDDQPIYWDAWDIMDYHLETAIVLNDPNTTRKIDFVTMVSSQPLAARLRWGMKLSDKSTISQDIVLHADTPYLTFDTTVDWKESHKVLKTVFEPDLLVREANFDIQFGYLTRPTHMNTSWDTARYEVCGHKWADLTEGNFGMSILNDSKYGWCARGNSLSMTMLKAPKAPDFNCDMRTHHFKYSVMPHSGSLMEAEVMRRGYEFNNPLRISEVPKTAIKPSESPENFGVKGEGIILHTVKPADDGSGDVIIRVFEHHGCRSTATISIPGLVSVKESDGLETNGNDVEVMTETNCTHIPVTLGPFKIAAYRLKPSASAQYSLYSYFSSYLPSF